MNHDIHTQYTSKPSRAESTIALPEHGRRLTITTRKEDGGGLLTSARVDTVKDGICTFIVHGDFYRRLVATKARATDKAVHAQHEQVLGSLDDLLRQASEHYRLKDELDNRHAVKSLLSQAA